jgi:hypothetical protein
MAGETALSLSLSLALLPLLSPSLLAIFDASRGWIADNETAVWIFGALLARPCHTGSRGRGLVIGGVEDGGCVRCGLWCAGAESAVGEVFVFVFFFALTTVDAG